MPAKNLWHLAFAHLIEQRAPPGFLVRKEVPLADEPQRVDLLLIRREDMPRSNGEAQILRGLWPHLRKDTVLEFKSPKSAFRRTDLMRLLSYGAQHHILAHQRLPTPDDLTLVLVVPAMNSALHDEIARMGLRLTWIGGGYGRIDGALYTLFLALTDEVSDEERDDFLRIFSHHERLTDDAFSWWQQWSAEDGTMQNIKTIEGYKEMRQKFVDSLTSEERITGLAPDARRKFIDSLTPEERLADLAPDARRKFIDSLTPEERLADLAPDARRKFIDSLTPEERLADLAPDARRKLVDSFAPEERLAGLAPEERLAGLTPEQQVLTTPDEILRGLPDDYLRSLPADMQDAIRKRIGRPSK